MTLRLATWGPLLAMLLATLPMLLSGTALAAGEGRLKDIGRIDGWRSNQLVGYGLVTGLAGTGDSLRNKTTRQSLANLLSRFDMTISSDQVQSRNVAAVMITATLPPVANVGDRLDVAVTSVGEARSLLGGVLLMTPLKGPDGRIYALAQGALSVGGYKVDLNGNVVQKNHPTVGMIPGGANVEAAVAVRAIRDDRSVRYVLSEPDYTTANRVAEAINHNFGQQLAIATDGGTVAITLPADYPPPRIVSFLTRLESLTVLPDRRARIVINERTGVVAAGGDVRIDQITVTHGELKVTIMTDTFVSQPQLLVQPGSGIRTELAARTRIDVQEDAVGILQTQGSNTVSELVQALGKMKVSPRDMISILQAIKAAGALRAELIIQ
jgi:flagellar P-ring protein precursor FlgI